MRANNVSPNTILAYGGAVRQFGRWLMDHGYPTDVDRIEPRHVEEWIGSILETSKPATAHNRWRGLQRFFNWYATRVDDFRQPDAQAPPAATAEAHAARPEMDELRAILGTCPGHDIRGPPRQRPHPHPLRHRRPSPRDRRTALLPDRPRDRDVDTPPRPVRVLGKGGKDNRIALATRRSPRSTTTCGPGGSTLTPTCRGSGSASAAG